MTELMCCPFCGGKSTLLVSFDTEDKERTMHYFVECDECHSKTVELLDAEDAIEAWNIICDKPEMRQ